MKPLRGVSVDLSSMTLWTLLVILSVCASSSLSLGTSEGKDPMTKRTCLDRACNPPMGNLAHGRLLRTRSECGSNTSEPFCFFRQTSAPRHGESCFPAKCSLCVSSIPGHAHPPSAMSDSSFRFPDSWWQSAGEMEEETLQLDLETKFLFTHLILVFCSPRPAAMVLERSQDHGRTWKALRFYAWSCEEVFGVDEGSPVTESGATCTSKYSAAFPCSRGEVIYRGLSPWSSVDPYGPVAQDQLMITNLRVKLLQRQQCPCLTKSSEVPVHPTDPYAIYDFIVKGSCLCNGHADQCVPARGYQPNQQKAANMVHGKCVCRHNTAGDHCERCAPLFNDRPWQAANGIMGTPHRCQKCKCNGHASSCHFSRGLWMATGRRSGGVCDQCHHNTEGRRCQSCKRGYYRDASRPKNAADSCKPCTCHPIGSVVQADGHLCHPSNGNCTCKPGVGGPHCDRCLMGHWGLHEHGCHPCDCLGDCDRYTGDCSSGSAVEILYAAADPERQSSNKSETALFRGEELFSALHHSVKCDCEEVAFDSPKHFCSAEFDYVLVVKVMSAHDKGSHVEVRAKIRKVLYQRPQMNIQRESVTLYPESWTIRGCTCPILNPGFEYIVAGHEDWNTGRLLINTKSLVKQWKSTLARKILNICRKCYGYS